MTPEIKALLAILIGILLCLSGYKIQKFLTTIIWFIIGFELAKLIGVHFISDANTLLIIEVVAGIILASVGFKLEKLALFITVSYLVFQTIAPYMHLIGYTEEIRLIAQGVISLLVGALSVLCIKPILIIITSLAGASLIKEAIPTFIALDANILLIAFAVIALVGIMIQFKTNER